MHTLGAEAFNNVVILCSWSQISRYNQTSFIQGAAENVAATRLSVESWSESPQVWKNANISNAGCEQLVLT